MTLSIQQIEELLGKIDIQSAYPDLWEDTACDIIRQLIKERNAFRYVAIQNYNAPDSLSDSSICKLVDDEANRLAGEVK